MFRPINRLANTISNLYIYISTTYIWTSVSQTSISPQARSIIVETSLLMFILIFLLNFPKLHKKWEVTSAELSALFKIKKKSLLREKKLVGGGSPPILRCYMPTPIPLTCRSDLKVPTTCSFSISFIYLKLKSSDTSTYFLHDVRDFKVWLYFILFLKAVVFFSVLYIFFSQLR